MKRIATCLVLIVSFAALIAWFGDVPAPRALIAAVALPFVLYVPGRLLMWGFLPGLDPIERTTASVLLSMMVSYTAIFLGEKTQPTVTGTVGVIAIAIANVGSALAAWIAARIRR